MVQPAQPGEGANPGFASWTNFARATPLACPWRGLGGFGPHGTNRQCNTHSTELREIDYPWHSWYGRSVLVDGALVKGGCALYRWSPEQNQEARLFEIPQWMFEPSACCRLRRAERPVVDCSALLALKLLLHRTRSPGRELVVQAEHHSSPGGVDARTGESTESSTKRIVSPAPADSGLAQAAARNQTEDRRTPGATVARTQPENADPSREGELR